MYGEIVEYSEKNDTKSMYFQFGTIARILFDFEPIVLEQASYDPDDDDITYSGQSSADNGIWGARPIVMQSENDTDDTNSTGEYTDTYDYYDINDISIDEFDWSFGLFTTFPGLKYLSELGGVFQFTVGFLNGT